MQYIAMKKDPDGLTRAWGIATTKERALEIADYQLGLYREKKRECGDAYLAEAEYTDDIQPLPEDDEEVTS